MTKKYYVALTIKGKKVSGGVVKCGTQKGCEKTMLRLNRSKGHPDCKYEVFESPLRFVAGFANTEHC